MRPPIPAALLGATMLASCTALVQPVPTTVATSGMPNPEEALRASIRHIDAEMAELGQLRPTSLTASARPVMPADLQRIVSFSWTGSLDRAAARLAQSIGYTFYTTAPPQSKPVNVTITLSSVPAYQVFQVLGEEAGARATVKIDALHHSVEVIHHV